MCRLPRQEMFHFRILVNSSKKPNREQIKMDGKMRPSGKNKKEGIKRVSLAELCRIFFLVFRDYGL